MLPRDKDYFYNDHQDEHWVNNPFIPDRQKIRMFEDMMSLCKKIGVIEERKRVLKLIKEQVKISKEGDSLWGNNFLPGLKLIESMINDDLDKLTK